MDDSMAMVADIAKRAKAGSGGMSAKDRKYLDGLIKLFSAHGHEPEAARLKAELS